ncbi:unnamed protein product [Heligmosomoides polygyrus]|uniref:GAGA-binding transcriptional activator n=1 Tax=Heligmosomoides polygyrus TaxID=6339 RepID=A0A183GR53_HELPZ|nr:unnamed protein product [Heligmosomoides polygyrus]
MSPRQGLETDKGNGLDDKPKLAGETGPTLIRGKERKRPISRNPSPKRKALNAKDPAPQTKPLTDEEYVDWLIEQSNNYDDDTKLSSDESAPPKQTRLEENIPIALNAHRWMKGNSCSGTLPTLSLDSNTCRSEKIGETSRGVAPQIQCGFCRTWGLHY